jgi:hypothetical protein
MAGAVARRLTIAERGGKNSKLKVFPNNECDLPAGRGVLIEKPR